MQQSNNNSDISVQAMQKSTNDQIAQVYDSIPVQEENERREFKVVLCGDGGVGKTTMAKRMLTNAPFDPRYVPTLGVEVYPIRHNEAECSVWDCAGQEKYGGLRDGYFIGADHIALVYSSSTISQKGLKYWFDMAKRAAPTAKISLVGNEPQETKVPTLVHAFCDAHPEIRHVRINAKTMTGGQLRLNILGTH